MEMEYKIVYRPNSKLHDFKDYFGFIYVALIWDISSLSIRYTVEIIEEKEVLPLHDFLDVTCFLNHL